MKFNFRFIRAISYFFLLTFTMSCEKTNGNETDLIIQYPITKKNNV